jgi:hypothetical protein
VGKVQAVLWTQWISAHNSGDSVIIATFAAIAGIGVFLLAALIVLTVRRRGTTSPAEAPGRFPWIWPFLWIVFIPLVTVPLSAAWLHRVVVVGYPHCVERVGEVHMFVPYECPAGDMLPALLPGLLNLGAFFWVLSPRKRVQIAAVVAGSLGTARLLVPLLSIWRADTVVVGTLGGWHIEHESVFVSLLLWLLSVVAMLVFGVASWSVSATRRAAR